MRAFATIVPIVLAATLALPAQAADDGSGTIAIEGRGEVMAAPDTALITSGVTTQGPTAREALDANSAAMTELLQTLKEAGIESRDIQTSGFSVHPNYVYTDARDENGYTLPPKIDGYQVSNTVTVRVRQLDALGAVLDQAVTVGANTINGISFSVADPAALLDEARSKAFEDARRRATLYAELAEVELGNIHRIEESQLQGGPQPYQMQTAMYDRAEAASVPVEAGELTFPVTVTVTWELED
ncbi:MAG TPA: SIMPL domain-containing protein [Devosiaceae bacterium]|jgi:hypothetical protein|nr:SIMPL domain-containing protein [Devosiaceae bacterium]